MYVSDFISRHFINSSEIGIKPTEHIRDLLDHCGRHLEGVQSHCILTRPEGIRREIAKEANVASH
jgi:hypothetical protein